MGQNDCDISCVNDAVALSWQSLHCTHYCQAWFISYCTQTYNKSKAGGGGLDQHGITLVRQKRERERQNRNTAYSVHFIKRQNSKRENILSEREYSPPASSSLYCLVRQGECNSREPDPHQVTHTYQFADPSPSWLLQSNPSLAIAGIVTPTTIKTAIKHCRQAERVSLWQHWQHWLC